MKVLITGGAGFIGTHLVERLLSSFKNKSKEDNKIIVIDNLCSSSIENVNLFINNKNYTFINHDLVTFDFSNFEKVDLVYHLACPASPPKYQSIPIETMDVCYIGSKKVFDYCLKYKIKVLIASTSEVYGDPLISPQKEEYRGNVNSFGVRSCYDEGKRIMESLAFEYIKLGCDIKIARIFNTYGKYLNRDDGRVISNFLKNKDGVIEVYGDGEQTRCFLYIDDLLDGFEILINTNLNEPVNIGSDDEKSINDVIKIFRKYGNFEVKYIEEVKDDPRQRKPDLTKIRSLSWNWKVSLGDGLERLI